MITYQDILKKAETHPMGEGKMVRYETPQLIISIVGGRRGLYGDFKKTFEMALIDKESKNFVSNYFYPEYSDGGEIMSWVPREDMLKIVNELVRE